MLLWKANIMDLPVLQLKKVKFFQDENFEQELIELIEKTGRKYHTGDTVVDASILAEKLIEHFNRAMAF